jgi:hypothetical protein
MSQKLPDSLRGVVLAAVIVAVNFALALQVTGLSYGRYHWAAFGVSYESTPTATATATSTGAIPPTPTATPAMPNGEPCSTASQCQSTFCIDGVCCNSACAQGTCDLPGSEGICVTPAPAPALHPSWLAAAVLMLALLGGLAMRRRLRAGR